MRISEEERRAVEQVLAAGKAWGFGNMTAHLQTAWAKCLMDEHGFDEGAARRGALGPGYPFAMQEDILERGEWDETGRRYTKVEGQPRAT